MNTETTNALTLELGKDIKTLDNLGTLSAQLNQMVNYPGKHHTSGLPLSQGDVEA